MSRIRITVACPEAMRNDANALAMVLAEGPADGVTYGAAHWQDSSGNRYAVASFEARPEWVQGAQAPLTRPDWDTGPPYIVNMTGAGRAQAILRLATGPILADSGYLTALAGLSASEALAVLGLTAAPP